jgi:hypothetical protein
LSFKSFESDSPRHNPTINPSSIDNINTGKKNWRDKNK